jgi:4-hydroxy-2-oxoheptanedioate aldolase
MGATTVAEIMATVGFDFLIIDLEHGQEGLSLSLDMIRAIQLTKTSCIVRIPSADPVFLKRILDAGVDGVMVPSVESAEVARNVVSACRYPPAGMRGFAAPNVRASRYGTNADYMLGANDNLLIIVQIESASAVENAEEICAVDGIDVVFIGVYDLAGSIGRLDQVDHSDVRDLFLRTESAIRASGKVMGAGPTPEVKWKTLFEQGYRFVPLASDVGLLRDSGQTIACGVEAFLHDPARARR